MKTNALLSSVALAVAGCAGLDITPISASDGEKWHTGASNRPKGYIIYAPMAVVAITPKEVCADKDEKGNCKGTSEVICAAGTPFTFARSFKAISR